MSEEEMTIEAARSMMEHGIDSPRRTDLIWKIRLFMNMFGLGERSPAGLIGALEVAGLKIVHADHVGCPVTPSECPLCPGFSAPCGNTNCPQLQSPADRQPPNAICKFCARRVFEPCQSAAQAQNACTLSSGNRNGET